MVSTSKTRDAERSDMKETSPFPLTDVDRYNLSITDEEYEPHTWEDLKQAIAANKLEILRRWPSDLKRYIKWSAETKAEYGTIMNFVLGKRLGWMLSTKSTPETGPLFDFQNPTPFADANDFKIMPNDWPYGLDQGIRHLIVWLKTRLETEPVRGDLTPRARQLIQNFVQKAFIEEVKNLPGAQEKVIWFKNWTALQSVPGIDHIHVLVRDVPQDLIDKWTGGEVPVQAWSNMA